MNKKEPCRGPAWEQLDGGGAEWMGQVGGEPATHQQLTAESYKHRRFLDEKKRSIIRFSVDNTSLVERLIQRMRFQPGLRPNR